MGKRSDLPVAKRREAVLALIRRQEAVSRLSRRYGVSEQTLTRWRDEFLAGGEAGLAGKTGGDPQARRIKELEEDVAQRDQFIGELTIANRILKKLSGDSP